MKQRSEPGLLAALACALVLAGAPGAASGDDSFSLGDLDKQAHIAVSYGLTLTGAVVLRRYEVPRWQAAAIGAAAALALGTVKELTDAEYSWGDQLANVIGAASAVVVVFSFSL